MSTRRCSDPSGHDRNHQHISLRPGMIEGMAQAPSGAGPWWSTKRNARWFDARCAVRARIWERGWRDAGDGDQGTNDGDRAACRFTHLTVQGSVGWKYTNVSEHFMPAGYLIHSRRPMPLDGEAATTISLADGSISGQSGRLGKKAGGKNCSTRCGAVRPVTERM